MKADTGAPSGTVRPVVRCRWSADWENNWFTTCGNIHVFFESGPAENRYEFCPYCGKPVDQVNAPYHGEAPNNRI